jgi:hypothetical protein
MPGVLVPAGAAAHYGAAQVGEIAQAFVDRHVSHTREVERPQIQALRGLIGSFKFSGEPLARPPGLAVDLDVRTVVGAQARGPTREKGWSWLGWFQLFEPNAKHNRPETEIRPG